MRRLWSALKAFWSVLRHGEGISPPRVPPVRLEPPDGNHEVRRLGGSGAVVNIKRFTSGADARRYIENERHAGERGQYFMDGTKRDWWPREA